MTDSAMSDLIGYMGQPVSAEVAVRSTKQLSALSHVLGKGVDTLGACYDGPALLAVAAVLIADIRASKDRQLAVNFVERVGRPGNPVILSRSSPSADAAVARVDDAWYQDATDAERSDVAEALALVAPDSWHSTVLDCTGLFLLQGRRSGAEPSESWTRADLPGCVFSTTGQDEPFLTVTLLHEASHNYLNLWLSASQLSLPHEKRFYSPWKNTERSARSMLHSIFAFCSVVSYLESLSQAEQPEAASRAGVNGASVMEKQRLLSCSSVLLAIGEMLPPVFSGLLTRAVKEATLCGPC